ncbi:MAG TPA: efflux RND transporter periplasmic adaptor subunit [Vicinamibacteria bacterium]|nr:efflux RND transporter periplasmic adaptor subunit [Vicinamibacteria bacterium]
MSDLKSDLASLRIHPQRAETRGWRRVVLLLLPALLLVAAVYGQRARLAQAGIEVETVRAVAVPAAAGRAAGTPILTASGYLVARRKAVVSAKIQGRLAELRVEEGSRVRRGEVIARLESDDYQAQVERTQAAAERALGDLAESRRQLRLASELAAIGVLAVDQREAAESRVKIAEAALRQAQAEVTFSQASLENTLIKAPFTGTIIKRMAEVGESVAPIPPGGSISTSSGAIAALADLDTLELEADVSESSLAKLGGGQPAEVTVEAFPDRKCRAVLRQVSPTADRTKATVQVRVTILDPHQDVKPEMGAKVTFLADQRGPAAPASVVVVPRDAVVVREGRSVVFEVSKGRARQREIDRGDEREDGIVVRSGLSGGEVLVAPPPEKLQDGETVRVKR